jgi:hypothetical protein
MCVGSVAGEGGIRFQDISGNPEYLSRLTRWAQALLARFQISRGCGFPGQIRRFILNSLEITLVSVVSLIAPVVFLFLVTGVGPFCRFWPAIALIGLPPSGSHVCIVPLFLVSCPEQKLTIGGMRNVGQPILAADPLSSGSSRLKAGLQA